MLTALAAGDGGNGMYKYGASGYPTSTFGATNYWVDLTFERTVPPDTRGPVATEVSPAASASDVGRNANATATFDEQLAPSSVNAQTFTLRGDGGALVPAAVSYDAQTRTAKLDPDVPLAYQTTLHRDAEGRRRRRHRRGRQPADGRQDVELPGPGPAADGGPGRSDPRAHRAERPSSTPTTRRSCAARA